MQGEHALPPNAYLEPNNPLAVFPQVKKPDIIDFRCHKIANGAYAAKNTFRKMLSKNAKKSKYEAVIVTAEEEAAMEAAKAEEMEIEQENMKFESAKATREEMEELAALTEKMSIEKAEKKKRVRSKKSDGMDIDDGNKSVPKIQIKSKAI